VFLYFTYIGNYGPIRLLDLSRADVVKIMISYLNSIDVKDNVHAVADPAFVMDAVKPDGIDDEFPIDEEVDWPKLQPVDGEVRR
jgi:hypothetical protein